MFLHVRKGKAIFGVPISFGHQGFHNPIFFKKLSEFVLDVGEISLNMV
jgi:hypothetical protein